MFINTIQFGLLSFSLAASNPFYILHSVNQSNKIISILPPVFFHSEFGGG